MRRSLRLPSFDYATPAAYFITLITHERAPLFGQPSPTGTIDLTPAGRMVQQWWMEASQKFPTVERDASVVMPDHFHALFALNCVDAPSPATLVQVVHWFKTMTTNAYYAGVKDGGWPAVHQRVWQRSFYDRVVRNEREFLALRDYIASNPGALLERMRP